MTAYVGDGMMEPRPDRLPQTKADLVEWLVRWRQERGGSISPANHRRLLLTRSRSDLAKMAAQIQSQEGKPADD